MDAKELYEKMEKFHQEYSAALAVHNLSEAGIVRYNAAMLLAQEWEQVNSALERAAAPLSDGTEPDQQDG